MRIWSSLQTSTGQDRIVLRADEHAEHGTVVELIDIIKESGFRRVSLAARPQGGCERRKPKSERARILSRNSWRRTTARGLASGLSLGALALALLGGCNSDTPNGVGADLAGTVIDTTLCALTEDRVTDYGVLDIAEAGSPLDQDEVLYLGTTAWTPARSVANYDFSVLDHPDSASCLPYLTADNIVSVKLILIMLTWYSPGHGDTVITDSTAVIKPWFGADQGVRRARARSPVRHPDLSGARTGVRARIAECRGPAPTRGTRATSSSPARRPACRLDRAAGKSRTSSSARGSARSPACSAFPARR